MRKILKKILYIIIKIIPYMTNIKFKLISKINSITKSILKYKLRFMLNFMEITQEILKIRKFQSFTIIDFIRRIFVILAAFALIVLFCWISHETTRYYYTGW